jgi:hypothetical protein
MVAEQLYGEHGTINNMILTKNIPTAPHLNRAFTSGIEIGISRNKNGKADCDDDMSANLASSGLIASGVVSPLF